MAKNNHYPKTLFVKYNDNGEDSYLSADADAETLLEQGENAVIAEYKLVTTVKARLVPEFKR